MTKSNQKTTKRRLQKASLSLKKMATDVKQPLAIMGGMVVGKVLSDLIDKGFSKATTVSGLKGLDNVSALIKPTVLIAAGLAGKQLMKNQLLNDLSIGVSAYGGAIAVQEVLNLPVLNKLTGNENQLPSGTSGLGAVDYSKLMPPSRYVEFNRQLPSLESQIK